MCRKLRLKYIFCVSYSRQRLFIQADLNILLFIFIYYYYYFKTFVEFIQFYLLYFYQKYKFLNGRGCCIFVLLQSYSFIIKVNYFFDALWQNMTFLHENNEVNRFTRENNMIFSNYLPCLN